MYLVRGGIAHCPDEINSSPVRGFCSSGSTDPDNARVTINVLFSCPYISYSYISDVQDALKILFVVHIIF